MALCCTAVSCTIDKADYEAEAGNSETDRYEFEEATTLHTQGYNISIEVPNGEFRKGYNEIRVKIEDSKGKNANASTVTSLPIMSRYADGSNLSCPHQYHLTHNDDGYFEGYAVFTEESEKGDWQIYIGFTVNGVSYQTNGSITVNEQTNKNLNMTSFTGNDGEAYTIALIAPRKPEVAENDIVAGIYKRNHPTGEPETFPDSSHFSYSRVNGYTLQLDPRMPEPSMGNHSSPNNRDLTQQSDSLYHGVVNYTMTGNWTLNFILLDQSGKIVKGTKVPSDFTPGVEGVKSELFIDILF